jgi:hypothetical protein
MYPGVEYEYKAPNLPMHKQSDPGGLVVGTTLQPHACVCIFFTIPQTHKFFNTSLTRISLASFYELIDVILLGWIKCISVLKNG